MTSQQEYDKLCEYESTNKHSPALLDNQAADTDITDFEIAVVDGVPRLDKKERESAKSGKGAKGGKKPPDRGARCFDLVSYLPVTALHNFLVDQPFIEHFAYCVHDKDMERDKETGELRPEGKHIQIVLYTKNQHTSSAIVKRFDAYAKGLVKDGELYEHTRAIYCKDVVDRYRYLIHADETDVIKHHYLPSERITDNDNYWSRLEKTSGMNDVEKNVALAMVDDFIAGVGHYEMTEKYGWKFLQQRRNIQDIAHRSCIEKGWPLRSVDYAQDNKLGDTAVRWILDSSQFSELEKEIFYMVWYYVQSKSCMEYGSVLDIYLQERN